MTVTELINALRVYEPDTKVVIYKDGTGRLCQVQSVNPTNADMLRDRSGDFVPNGHVKSYTVAELRIN